MRKYFNYSIDKVVNITKLVTIELLNLTPTFKYPSEIHEFYEFVYVDSGSINCMVNDENIKLNQSDFLLIHPHTEHYYNAIPTVSSSVFIVCFQCKSNILQYIDGKITTNKDIRTLILDLVEEAYNTFKFPFNKKLELAKTPLFGGQQLIENRIEEILIKLLRMKTQKSSNIKFVMNSIELEDCLSNDIIKILEKNIYNNITLDEISKKVYYSKTFINNIFKKNTGRTIMQYYTILKITEAKKMLDKNFSVSMISDKLNFDNPNYFNKVFKKYTNMTPSQYKKTIL